MAFSAMGGLQTEPAHTESSLQRRKIFKNLVYTFLLFVVSRLNVYNKIHSHFSIQFCSCFDTSLYNANVPFPWHSDSRLKLAAQHVKSYFQQAQTR